MSGKRIIATIDSTGSGMAGTDGMISANCYRAGNLVFLTGQTGFTLDGTLVGVGDVAAQTHQACQNIDALMRMAGGSIKDVVKTITYVTDRSYREIVYPIMRSYYDIHPCSTGLVVDGLAIPELLVEIDAWGWIDD